MCSGNNPAHPCRCGPAVGTPAGTLCSRMLLPLKHAADIKAKTHDATTLTCHSHRCSPGGTIPPAPAAPRFASPQCPREGMAASSPGPPSPGPLPSQGRPGPFGSPPPRAHLPRRALDFYISSRFWKLMLAYALKSSLAWLLPRGWPGAFGGGCFPPGRAAPSAEGCRWWRRWLQSFTKSRSM